MIALYDKFAKLKTPSFCIEVIMESVKSLTVILLAVSMAVTSQFMLKAGMNAIGKIDLSLQTNYILKFIEVFSQPYIISGFLLYGFGALLWLIALSRVDLSFAYPFVSLSIVLVVAVSILKFGEPFTLNRVLGTLLIALGIIIISRQ